MPEQNTVKCVSCGRENVKVDRHGFLKRHPRKEAFAGRCDGSDRHVSFNGPADGPPGDMHEPPAYAGELEYADQVHPFTD